MTGNDQMPGAFPYALSKGAEESRYLIWVRNHSNYMAERGFLDYMRIVAVLIRGILINFLTLLPYLLVAALVLGWVYAPLLQGWVDGDLLPVGKSTQWANWVQGLLGTRPPFLLTPWVAMLALGWYLLFPMVIRLFKVETHKQSLATGNESSVKLRDRYERTFGGALIIVMAFALIELIPLLVHLFHASHKLGPKLREGIAMIAGGSSVCAMSGAGAMLSRLGKVMQVVAMAFISLLGLVLPLLVIFYVMEYLVYCTGSCPVAWWFMAVIPILLGVGILLVFILGSIKGSFEKHGWLLGIFAIVAVVVAGIYLLKGVFPNQRGFFVLAMAVEIWLFCWLVVDVNLTSVHGLYRDRLAAAYLVGDDTEGDVDIEEDIDLSKICQHDNGSTAPYHLINVALNLQSSKDMGIRERNSDFFIFSKNYIGGSRTGYCRSETMEAVFPQMDLATAMAISAAAASPNMGTGTSAPLVAIMTLLNIRLGYWIPNPGRLATWWAERILGLPEGEQGAELGKLAECLDTDAAVVRSRLEALVKGADSMGDSPGRGNPPGFTFGEVFKDELQEVQNRWEQAYGAGAEGRSLSDATSPSTEHGLVGLGFSGGGIRSATINLGIAQALHERGIFNHVDYMSTVSGGGYLGASISTLMRKKRFISAIDGRVRRDGIRDGLQQEAIVGDGGQTREINVPRGNLWERFQWRVRPGAFLREMGSRLDEVHNWVNLSDGGHIENLATIELLRRRCKFIITGDGEADPNLHFAGLATLIRYARIDLGIDIDIDVNDLRLKDPEKDRRSAGHVAIGRIRYPGEKACGYLLYLKSSFTGDEDEVIVEYRNRNPSFPHESTADQFFDEGQFEAYRALGQHIGESALAHAPAAGKLNYADLTLWFETMGSGPSPTPEDGIAASEG